jgi:hypothetical protein
VRENHRPATSHWQTLSHNVVDIEFNVHENHRPAASHWQTLSHNVVDIEFNVHENHRPAASHWQTLSHNVVSSTPRLSGMRTHSVSDNGQLPYDHNHNSQR